MTGTPDGWRFRKSSQSADDKCVELGRDGDGVLGSIRDSKNPDGPMLLGSGLQIGLMLATLRSADNG
jgi:hypothetical protein